MGWDVSFFFFFVVSYDPHSFSSWCFVLLGIETSIRFQHHYLILNEPGLHTEKP